MKLWQWVRINALSYAVAFVLIMVLCWVWRGTETPPNCPPCPPCEEVTK